MFSLQIGHILMPIMHMLQQMEWPHGRKTWDTSLSKQILQSRDSFTFWISFSSFEFWSSKNLLKPWFLHFKSEFWISPSSLEFWSTLMFGFALRHWFLCLNSGVCSSTILGFSLSFWTFDNITTLAGFADNIEEWEFDAAWYEALFWPLDGATVDEVVDEAEEDEE